MLKNMTARLLLATALLAAAVSASAPTIPWEDAPVSDVR